MRIHPSKQDALILDFGGNVLRHGPVDALTIRRREGIGGDAPVKACPECQEIVHASARQCPACGAAFEIASKGPHGVSATNLPVLNEPVELPVHGASYVLHRKDGKPDSVRVTYRSGLQAYSEWVCLEHGGYAQHKAAKWWAERGGKEPVPTTAIEALGRTRELRQPVTITVRREGEYWRVLSARLESEAA